MDNVPTDEMSGTCVTTTNTCSRRGLPGASCGSWTCPEGNWECCSEALVGAGNCTSDSDSCYMSNYSIAGKQSIKCSESNFTRINQTGKQWHPQPNCKWHNALSRSLSTSSSPSSSGTDVGMVVVIILAILVGCALCVRICVPCICPHRTGDEGQATVMAKMDPASSTGPEKAQEQA